MGEGEMRKVGEALDSLDLGSFVGADVGVLQLAVEEVGGVVRVLRPGAVVTLEYRGDRVDATVDDAGIVEDVRRS